MSNTNTSQAPRLVLLSFGLSLAFCLLIDALSPLRGGRSSSMANLFGLSWHIHMPWLGDALLMNNALVHA